MANHDLNGQWILVTGAARRIGAAICKTLHGAGANIAVHYRGSESEASRLCRSLNDQRPDSAFAFRADITATAGIGEFIDRVIRKTGRLDALINNASTFYPTPIDTITEEQWDDLVGTNFKAPLFIASAAAPHLRRTRGVIINMIDIHARRPLEDHPIYGPAKAALAMLTLSLARDLGPEIRVNGVAPGAILWPESGLTDESKRKIIGCVPLQRTGSPEDIAGCVLYLVRDAAYVSGQIIAVDGGRSVGW